MPESLIDEFYVVDFCIPAEKLVVEVYGPIHYNARGELSKKQVLKAQILEKLGYKVVAIPRHVMRTTEDASVKMRAALAIARK